MTLSMASLPRFWRLPMPRYSELERRFSRPRAALASRSLTTRNSQFWPLEPVGALRASSMHFSTMASSTGSGFRRRMARWVSIASCSGISRPFSTSASVFCSVTSVMSPPNLEAEVEKATHVIDVGLEVRDGGDHVGDLRQLRPLLLLPLGHDLEVQVALADLAQDGRNYRRVRDERLDGVGDLGSVGAQALGHAGRLGIGQVVGLA